MMLDTTPEPPVSWASYGTAALLTAALYPIMMMSLYGSVGATGPFVGIDHIFRALASILAGIGIALFGVSLTRSARHRARHRADHRLLTRWDNQYLTTRQINQTVRDNPGSAEPLRRLRQHLAQLRSSTALAQGLIPETTSETLDDLEWALTSAIIATAAGRNNLAEAASRPELADIVAHHTEQLDSAAAQTDQHLAHLEHLAAAAQSIDSRLEGEKINVTLQAATDHLAGRANQTHTDLVTLVEAAQAVDGFLDEQAHKTDSDHTPRFGSHL